MAASVEQVSHVAAPAGEVWARAITPEGINHELGPWLRMTMPPGLRGATIDDVRVGEPLGRSWLLPGRVLPVDYDDLCLAELEPGRRFLERSSMLSMRLWQRRPLAWIPGADRIAAAAVRRIFAHRHRRLAADFNAKQS